MFEDNYKKEMDSIHPDEDTKQKILTKIKNQENSKPNFKLRTFKSLVSVAACFAIAISVWAIHSARTDNIKTVTGDYSEIYSAVKTFMPKKMSAIEKLYGYVTGDYELYSKEAVDIFTDVGALYDEEEGVIAESDSENGATAGTGATVNKGSSSSHSETTTQVEGVSEADIVKTDGEYIYYLNPETGIFRIIKAGKSPKALSSVKITNNEFPNVNEMYLIGDRVVIVGTIYVGSQIEQKTVAYIYSVKNPEKPERLYTCEQSGYYNDSRMIGDKLYLISSHQLNTYEIESDSPETYVPSVECGNYNGLEKANTVVVNDVCKRPEYTVICGYSTKSGELLGSRSVLGGIQTLYCSTKNIIIAGLEGDGKTAIYRYSINNGQIEHEATGEIKGYLLNQFSIDEYKENFRFVTTINSYINRKSANGYTYQETVTNNSLYVLDKNLKQIGAIDDIAPNERVYSVRFMGDIAYFVTFRQVDPLFSVDLSNPKKPEIIGSLKIPGFSNYLYPYGEGMLFGIGKDADEKTGVTGNIKLSMFDIQNGANVNEIAKEIISQSYSQALYDHKAILVDSTKNLIGFAANGYDNTHYLIYNFQNGDFRKLAEIELENVYEFVRGIYIENEFYIISDNHIFSYDINTFKMLGRLHFNG